MTGVLYLAPDGVFVSRGYPEVRCFRRLSMVDRETRATTAHEMNCDTLYPILHSDLNLVSSPVSSVFHTRSGAGFSYKACSAHTWYNFCRRCSSYLLARRQPQRCSCVESKAPGAASRALHPILPWISVPGFHGTERSSRHG